MGKAAVWFIVCIMAFLALFPWLYRYYEKRPFLWLLAASVLFAAFRSGTVMDYGRLYYQVSFRLWQFLLGMWCASWNMERWKSPWRWFWIGAGAAWLLASSAATHEGIGALSYSFPGYVVSSVIFALCIASLCPCLPPPEMGGDWRGNGLRPFSVPHAGDAGHGRSTPHAAGTCGNEVGGGWPPVLFWGIALCVSLVIAYFVYQQSACGGLPGGEEAEKGAGNPE